MRELTSIRDAVISAFGSAGLKAMPAYPAERAGDCLGAVAAVSVESVESRAAGLTGYLGQEADGAGGVREIYGKRLEGIICADIWARRASVCQTGCEIAEAALLEGLPSGIRPGELSWEAIRYERESGMFARRCRLKCRAFFTASRQEDGPAFLEFELKGVLRH